MLTNEQILNILNTWTVYNASIYDNDVTLRLINSTKKYLIEFSKHIMSFDNSKSFKFQLSKINDISSDIYTYILTKSIPNDIQLEVEYLVTTKVKNYIKAEIDNMYIPEGLDILLGDTNRI